MSKILLIEGDLNNAIFGFRKHLVDKLNLNHNLIVVGSSSINIQKDILSNKKYKIYYLGTLKSNPFYFLFYLIRIFFILHKEKPDICLSYNLRPNIAIGIANYFFKINSIGTITGSSTFFSKSQNIKIKLLKFIFKKFKYLFFQNNDDKEIFEIKGIKAINHVLVPGSGVDTNYFNPEKIKFKTEYNFTLISRIIKEKGILEFIEAAETVKKLGYIANFNILGPFYKSGPKYNIIDDTIISSAEQKGIIQYLGITNDVKSYILKSDCIVLPSYREGMSNLLLEAASLAKPIITTDVPGCKEIVEDNYNGYLCQAKSTKDLVDKIIKFISLPIEDKIRMGINGRNKMINEFDKSIVINKYLFAINTLI